MKVIIESLNKIPMFADINLRELADIKAPERAFLSVYIAGKHSLVDFEKRLHRTRNMLKGGAIGRNHSIKLVWSMK
jgi:hypothetical protein